MAEELWQLLGHKKTITYAEYPSYDENYLKQDTKEYPVSFNGKVRFKIELALDMPKEEIEKIILEAEQSQKWLQGKPPRKIIVVPNRIINIVI